uniref:Proteins of 100 residues with WXG n=1 Tax=Mycobacterium riyadhense TaxID=486698 RepID=A0A653EY82_9MYCO|nr:Proteins of 100 residues with WXG [Mycobacterium riyadhense]
MSQPLNTDHAQMMSAAAQMDNIASEVLAALGRYGTMNQNLTGSGFIGDAAMASMASTEDIQNTGHQVSARFQSVIDMIKRSAHQYQEVNNQNRAALSNIQST